MQALLLFCFAAGSYAEQDLPLLARPVTPLTLNTPRLFLPHIQTGAMAEYFVSTTGSDTTGDGSADKPWATMDHARLAVRALIADGMTGDVFVYFSSGVYSLSEPVTFDPQDSATAPFTIHYSTNPADPDAPAVISGGTVVPGPWKPAPSGPAFMASYSGPQSRQLFINAQRAPPARFNASFMKAVGNLTDVGYHLFNDDTVLRWAVAQPGGEPLEFVYTGVGSSWTEARCRTDSVTSDGAGGTVIVMQQPCWANGRARGGSQNSYQAISWPATIENVAAGLAYGGDSFLSPGTDTVYYVPRLGEDMNAPSTSAVIPTAASLLVLAGTPGSGGAPPTFVSGLSFEGLVFEHATWLLPSSGQGYIDNQAGQIYVGTPGVNATMMLTPAAVSAHAASRVSFLGCTFQQLGLTALLVDGGSRDCNLANNSFWDISGSAMFIGDVDDPSAPPDEQDGGHLVFNNYISELPQEYHGCGALVTGYVQSTNITHNEIWNASDGSIESGWGWGGGDYATNNSITHNKIVNSNWLLVDCGSIYVNGVNDGSVIAYNYCANQTQKFGALYPDEGSSLWNIHDNVVDNCVEWLHIWTSSINRITVEDNFYGPLTFNTSKGTNCTVENNTWVPPGTPWPQGALDIIAGAGLV